MDLAPLGPVVAIVPASSERFFICARNTDLERSEPEMRRGAKISGDAAMYSFTDRELAAELARPRAAVFQAVCSLSLGTHPTYQSYAEGRENGRPKQLGPK